MKRSLTQSTRNQVLARDNFTCQKCKLNDNTGKQLEVHHIHLLAFGGIDEKDNLITLCSVCHKYAPNNKEEFEGYMASECDGQLTVLIKLLNEFKESEEGKRLIKQIEER